MRQELPTLFQTNLIHDIYKEEYKPEQMFESARIRNK